MSSKRGMAYRHRGSLRRRGRVVVVAASLAMLWGFAHSQDVVISEFLTLNEGVLRDADREDPDWIEIENRGPAIDLGGWYLTDDPGDLEKWRFPAVELAPGAFVVVFASGKDRAEPGAELHTDFSLSQDGEYLALVLPDGRSVAHEYAPTYPRQFRNVSYGLSTEGEVRYFETPTPGSENDMSGVAGFVADTRFSVDRGFYETPFDVEITTDTEGAEIRYTLDGREPTETRGEVYRGPIRIEETTTLRAAAFKPDLGPTNVDTHTYIFVEDVIEQRGMLRDIIEDEVYGPEILPALTRIPTIAVTTGRPVSTVEIKASAELIFPDGTDGFQIDAGIKKVGGHSLASYPKNNMRLYFRKKYGRARLKFPLFEGLRYGEGAADTFDQLTLRSGSHDSVFYLGDNQQAPSNAQYLRNRWMSDMEFEMGRLSLHGRFVHLYLDGIYWGHYHLMERPTDSYLASYLGGERDEYEAVNSGRNVGGPAQAFGRMRQVRGDYAEAQRWIDVTNLADYVLLNFYAGNAWDWRPNQNWMGGGPSDPDRGGYQFFSWDTDIVLRRTTDNNLNQPGPDNLFRDLLRHEEFRVLVADRIQRYFFDDGLLTPARVAEIYNRRAEEISRTIVAETARWRWRGRRWTRDEQWQREWDRLRDDFFPRRTDIVIQQLRGNRLLPELEPPRLSQRGGRIEPGFTLVMTAPVGQVVYTLDGTDPRLPGGEVSPDAFQAGSSESEPLLAAGAPVRVLVPTSAALGRSWIESDFDDGGWLEGETGVGFERSSGYEELILTDVEASMYQENSTVYLRIPFTVPLEVDFSGAFLSLHVKYDDGFIAYLNGERIAGRNAPSDPRWDSRATGGHPDRDAVIFERIDVTEYAELLKPGENLLAVHAMNASNNSPDMLILPELQVSRSTGGGVQLERTTLVKARALAGDEWSPLTEATFVVTSTPPRITEIMYHPPAGPPGNPFDDEDFEFIELANAGTFPLNLSGVRISGGIEFTFPEDHHPLADLAPGDAVVVVRNGAAFTARYGDAMRIAGEYSGRLSNGGERLRVTDRLGETVLEFTYDDAWYPTTDGGGHSLEIVDVTADVALWNDVEAWRPSLESLGSPGRHSGGPVAGGRQRAGDFNQDTEVDISDAVAFLRVLFVGTPESLPCGGDLGDEGNSMLLDVNGDSHVNLTDAVHLLEYLFNAGGEPALGTDCLLIADCPDVCLR